MNERDSSHRNRRAVILIGHGSRAAGADDDMERIAAELRAAEGGRTVAVCRMEGRGRPFAEVFANCVAAGASEVLVMPYFLHHGVHLREDIPGMLRAAAAAHPSVRLVLGRHLGYDPSLVALVARRIAESATLCDIRELADLPIDRRPGA